MKSACEINALPCPCGRRDAQRRALSFAACCGRYLNGIDGASAPDAHSLMRSRYTAFATGAQAYLLATWHRSTRPQALQIEPGTNWLGLEVRDHRVVDDTHAEVEFVARYRAGGGRAQRLHERSRFVKEGGRWYYVDGDIRE